MTQPSPRPDLPALEPQAEAARPFDEGEAFHAEFDRLQWAES